MEKNNKAIQKQIFDLLRVFIVEEFDEFTKDGLIKALTFNENIKFYGYKFNAESIYKLACCKNFNKMYDTFIDMMPKIKAKPMYSNFPNQVMEMDEAIFRYHQMLHYASTYGRELFECCEVLKGWLPECKEEERLEDKKLLDYTIIKVVTIEECCDLVVNKIINKKERFTYLESEIVECFILNYNLKFEEVPFKENLAFILNLVIRADKEKGRQYLKKFCNHTGDVYKVIETYYIDCLKNNHKHFTTSEKRLFVSVLESFPLNDFKSNIYLSKRIFETKIDTILRNISFNNLAKKEEYKEVVRQARNKEIKSWYATLEKKIEKNSHKEVLEFLKQRPGELLRRVFRLIKLGYSEKEITDALFESGNYKTQTIIETLNKFIEPLERDKRDKDVIAYCVQEFKIEPEEIDKILENRIILINVFKNLLLRQYQNTETILKSKKVFIDTTVFNFEQCLIKTNSKGDDSSYVRGGLSYTLPEDVDILRFFVYWNDEKRIDIDLHAIFETTNGDKLRVGWNSDYNTHGVIHSGDITHSDAAEYIDVNRKKAIKNNVKYVKFDIHSFTNVPFKYINTVFCGIMAVSNSKEKKQMKLHDVKNEFFHHDLNSNERYLKYAYYDVENNTLRVLLERGDDTSESLFGYSLKEFVEMLLISQECSLVENKDDADVILSLDKVDDERNVSLIDENFFFE